MLYSSCVRAVKITLFNREQSAEQSAGKKPEVVEKMIAGKVSKRLSEICLVDQVCVVYDASVSLLIASMVFVVPHG